MSSQPPPKKPSNPGVRAFATGGNRPATATYGPPPATIEDLHREVVRTRRLLDEVIKNNKREFDAARIRDEAILEMLGDLLKKQL